MSKYLFNDDKPSVPCGQECYVPVEDIWERIEEKLCSPKKRCCPPKTKARDAVRIDRDEVERCFNYGRRLCNGLTEQSVVNRFYRMEIRQQGFCDVLMCVPPNRATMDGAICWAWPKEFYILPLGYYEADIYIDNCLCHTHLFYLPECNVTAKIAEVSHRSQCSTCGDNISPCGCEVSGCSKIPVVDNEVSKQETEGCNKECTKC